MRGQAAPRVVASGSMRLSGCTIASAREPGGIGANRLLRLSLFDRCPGPPMVQPS